MKPYRIRQRLRAQSVLFATFLLGVAGAATGAPAAPAMDRARVEPAIELEYQLQGTGEPVVLLHAGLFAQWFQPLLNEPALTARYRVLSLHRVGYAGSSRVVGPVSIAQQAAQVDTLMRQLGIERAHVVGHSSGANIALQLAIDAPQRVHSLALLEPALPVGDSSERLLSTRQAAMAPVLESYRKGDKAAAVHGFMRIVAGPAYRAPFDEALPGAFDHGVADADTFFGQELPAIQQWRLAREDAGRITQPVLAVIGEKSTEVSPIWGERQKVLLDWLPNAEGFVLPGTTHLLHVQNPGGMAAALASFYARHPIKAAR
ncbi:alpha/beta fold hydrolase [Variovorax sp. J22R115]|uniref:alpha/beta fold hydrolase n=1 Tax=Variovorax sp. J22R115 TaxID=3053509 RepID=UPI002575DA1B|nr:alpha/beta hydrolase [Variovorax sp. J22R115]MDM0047715.1 alpha/beta hydrolase [Variovorax sp. J22R115]